VPVSGPVFDVEKLDWLNARYIRERHDAASLLERVREWGAKPERLTRIAALAAPRIERLSDLGPLVAFMFSGRLALRVQDLQSKKLDDDQTRQAFTLALTELDALPAWNAFAIQTALEGIAQRLGKKMRDVARPFYVAVTGSPTSIPLYDSMEMLGRDIVRERLRGALELLTRETAAV
jgi:glutamyl-tRNA synthetase